MLCHVRSSGHLKQSQCNRWWHRLYDPLKWQKLPAEWHSYHTTEDLHLQRWCHDNCKPYSTYTLLLHPVCTLPFHDVQNKLTKCLDALQWKLHDKRCEAMLLQLLGQKVAWCNMQFFFLSNRNVITNITFRFKILHITNFYYRVWKKYICLQDLKFKIRPSW